MTTEQLIQLITKYTNISIEHNRIRLGVCPSGVQASKFITYFDYSSEGGLNNALNDCVEYLAENNPYWEA